MLFVNLKSFINRNSIVGTISPHYLNNKNIKDMINISYSELIANFFLLVFLYLAFKEMCRKYFEE